MNWRGVKLGWISRDGVNPGCKTNSAREDAIAELECSLSSPGVNGPVPAIFAKEIENRSNRHSRRLFEIEVTEQQLTEIKSPFLLNQIQAIRRLEEKTSVPRLQLRACPSKHVGEKRADDAQVRASKKPSPRAIRHELGKVAAVWEQVQKTRARDAIYIYLEAVHDLVRDWERRGRADRRARRALRARGPKAPKHPEPYAAVIACTCTADIKARSKWARALRYVAGCRPSGKSLKERMRPWGGINGTSSLFARRLGRNHN
jgi:hypothetical protein